MFMESILAVFRTTARDSDDSSAIDEVGPDLREVDDQLNRVWMSDITGSSGSRVRLEF